MAFFPVLIRLDIVTRRLHDDKRWDRSHGVCYEVFLQEATETSLVMPLINGEACSLCRYTVMLTACAATPS